MEIILNTIIITYNIIMYLDPRKKIQIIIITYKINTPHNPQVKTYKCNSSNNTILLIKNNNYSKILKKYSLCQDNKIPVIISHLVTIIYQLITHICKIGQICLTKVILRSKGKKNSGPFVLGSSPIYPKKNIWKPLVFRNCIIWLISSKLKSIIGNSFCLIILNYE